MTMELTGPDILTIQVACKLASAAADAGAAEINSILEPVHRLHRRGTSSRWCPVADNLQLLHAVHGDMAFLRGSLDKIRAGGNPVQSRLKAALQSLSGAYVVIEVGGKRESRWFAEHTGVASVVGHALALLTDGRYGVRGRVGKCKRCGDYFFAKPTGNRGRFLTDYCSIKHRNAHLQSEKRERDRAHARKSV